MCCSLMLLPADVREILSKLESNVTPRVCLLIHTRPFSFSFPSCVHAAGFNKAGLQNRSKHKRLFFKCRFLISANTEMFFGNWNTMCPLAKGDI